MIPKIIHHFAPEDKNIWHPVWYKCIDSWFMHFSKTEYEHKFWNDYDIDKFVKNLYTEYYDVYNSFPSHIMKIDFARYLVIHKYGGLYVDMDVFCYKNFYHMLNKDAILTEMFIELVFENFMFGGTKKNFFFIKCVENAILKFNEHKEKINLNIIDPIYINFVHKITGSEMLTNTYNNYDKKSDIMILNNKKFNSHVLYYDNEIITKHMCTGLWGKEDINYHDKNKKQLSYNFCLKQNYFDLRKIDIKNFDFYKNYLEK